MDTVEVIDAVLKEKIAAEHVEITDDSHLHRGHKAAGGWGHYSVRVVSKEFENVDFVLNFCS